LVLLVRKIRILGAAVTVLFVWSSLAAGGGRDEPLDWSGGGVAKAGATSLRYPAGWHSPSTGASGLVITSFPVSDGWFAQERRSMPRGGVFIWAFTYRGLPRSADSLFLARPARLQLDPKTLAFYECGFGFEGYMVRFRENGIAVQAMVALGPEADPSAALAVLNRLRVG
jgi:hypothetical protein